MPTAASAGFILGELGASAALDEFSTVYELPLTHFEKRQTNKHTNRKLDAVPRTDLEWNLLLSYYSRSHGNLFVQQHVKGAIIVDHVTPPHGKIGRSKPDDCERTATVEFD